MKSEESQEKHSGLTDEQKKIITENSKILTNQRLPNEPIPKDGEPDLFRIRRKLQNAIVKKYKGRLVHESVTFDFDKNGDEIVGIVAKGITYVKPDNVQDSKESSEL